MNRVYFLVSPGLDSGSVELSSRRDEETCSDVTLQTQDTWGGLAAPVPPQPPSDEVCFVSKVNNYAWCALFRRARSCSHHHLL